MRQITELYDLYASVVFVDLLSLPFELHAGCVRRFNDC